ncbi:MAG: hypothetical protein LC744_05535 [Chloroflexi bacterium]|nr:hypothetical protein [Chloroflexota bacterium]
MDELDAIIGPTTLAAPDATPQAAVLHGAARARAPSARAAARGEVSS